MSHRSLRPVIAFAALCVLLAAGSAHAEKKVALPSGPRPADNLQGIIQIGNPRALQDSSCALGGVLPFFDDIDYIDPPQDQYFTLLDPATCTECTATGTMTVEEIHVRLTFQTACSQPAIVRLVEAKNEGCPEPDLTKPLMSYLPINVVAPGPGQWEALIALPEPVCLRGKAFLEVTFDQIGSLCTDGIQELPPYIAYGDTNLCEPCHYYNFYSSGGDLNKEQLCRAIAHWTPGPLLHWVTGHCCSLIPVQPATWGRLKIRYGSPRRVRRRRVRRPARRTTRLRHIRS
jgi:hypothetical protein